jgi:hypothetical protein
VAHEEPIGVVMRRALQRRLDGPTTVPADVVSRMGGRAVDRRVDFPERMVRDIRNSWVLMACRSISDCLEVPIAPANGLRNAKSTARFAWLAHGMARCMS